MDIDQDLVYQALHDVQTEFSAEENTEELRCAVQELTSGQPKKLIILNVVGSPEKFKAKIESEVSTIQDIRSFVLAYNAQTNETLRIEKGKKLTAKSSYVYVEHYRCQHKTRNPKTREVSKVLQKNPSKTLKNSNCAMSLIFKVRKDESSGFPCLIDLKWAHNHSTNTLRAWGFKDIPEFTTRTIRSLFAFGMTPATAYRDFVRTVRCNVSSEMEFHQILADRSKVPRRRDFSVLYTEYNRCVF